MKPTLGKYSEFDLKSSGSLRTLYVDIRHVGAVVPKKQETSHIIEDMCRKMQINSVNYS